MDCETASGLMPWLLNGTLDARESEALRAHLSSCTRCREEMEETRRAARVFGAHPASRDLVELAWERPVTDADLVRRHVEGCAECAEDLALARESRGAEIPAVRVSRVRALPWIALPATLAAGLVIGLAWPRAPVPPGPAPSDPRVSRLEAEIAGLQATVSGMRAEVERAAAPEVNIPVFELLAATLTRGPNGRGANVLGLAPDARHVALLLVPETATESPASLVIRGQSGGTIWKADGLRPSPLGAYTLSIPAALLPDGEYVLALTPDGAKPIEYRVRVKR